jgi:hypothetical protein
MNPVKYILMFLIKLYQWLLSPLKNALFGPFGRCRFTPSCSAYAWEAISVHGAMRGSWLALRRLCRCHPWGDFGPDPVPQARQCSHQESQIGHTQTGQSTAPLQSEPLTATGGHAR